jgi:ABC-type dipeptide/oligopeptide/nickel transport system permease component
VPGCARMGLDDPFSIQYFKWISSAFFVIAFNLIADILYAVLDPRIRYS